ncbi:MAG: hypothetical protein WDZ80_06785 [Candidatus Paceibacterota bacterium]
MDNQSNTPKEMLMKLEEISMKLTALLALQHKHLLGDSEFDIRKKTQNASAMVDFYREFDLDAKDIAPIIGTSAQSVRTLLTPHRKKQRKKNG